MNSLGFLDREPSAGKVEQQCKVLFIGDSFVEASQVPIEKKFHVVFEDLTRRHLPELNIETVALGYSGTGQSNQLAFYEVFGAPLQPDVVVLVAVSNDFANNAPLLESVRQGYHPLHLPRLFFRFTPDGGRRLPIDPDWEQHRLDDPANSTRALHKALHKHSYFYHWLFTHLQAQWPGVAKLLSGQSQADTWSKRMRTIEDISGFEDVFMGWRYPDDLDMDSIFYAVGPLPPIFEDALLLTGHAFDEFLEYAQQDSFRLVVLAIHKLSRRYGPSETRMQRRMLDRGYFQRLTGLLRSRNIPLVDQYDYLIGEGGTVQDARLRRDGHWSEQGHEWAAGAMLKYFLAHPEVCSK